MTSTVYSIVQGRRRRRGGRSGPVRLFVYDSHRRDTEVVPAAGPGAVLVVAVGHHLAVAGHLAQVGWSSARVQVRNWRALQVA